MNLNRIFFAGNLTADPVAGAEGRACNFSLACNRRWKDKDGNTKEEATFVDFEAWGKTAEAIQAYCTKGRALYIEGRLKNNRWETADGTKRQRIVVVVETFQFLDSNKDARTTAPAPQAAQVTALDDEQPAF